jgi:hypothetical protein
MRPPDHPSLSRSLTVLALAITVTLAGSARARADDDTALRLANVNEANTGFVRVANDPAFALQEFTLEAWIQRVGTGYGGTLDGLGAAVLAKPIEGLTGSYLGSWHLNWTSSGSLIFMVVHTAASSGVFVTAPAVTTPLGRHHVAATFDGDSVRAFVDGVQAAQAGWNLGSVYYGDDDVLIGAQNFGSGFLRRFDGFIDDVRIWDHARTPSEIAADMNCRLSGSEAGLVSYWTFDASDLSDATGHGHGGAVDGLAGSVTYESLASISSCAVGVDAMPLASPTGLAMALSPQPARGGQVSLRLELPREGRVTLDVLDVAGRNRGVLASRQLAAGRHELLQDLTALRAGGSSGVFFLRLRFEGQTVVQRLVLVR